MHVHKKLILYLVHSLNIYQNTQYVNNQTDSEFERDGADLYFDIATFAAESDRAIAAGVGLKHEGMNNITAFDDDLFNAAGVFGPVAPLVSSFVSPWP